MMTPVRRPTIGWMPSPPGDLIDSILDDDPEEGDLIQVTLTHVDGQHLRVVTPDGRLHAATFADVRELRLRSQP